MAGRDRITPPSEEELVEMGKMILEMSGWPSWPPKETPPASDWWKSEISVPPTTEAIFLPNISVVEINGLPQTGKSTTEIALKELVEKKLQDNDLASEVTIIHDPVITTPFVVQDTSQVLFLGEDDIPSLQERDSWLTSPLLQFGKEQWWAKFVRSPESFLDITKRNVVMVYREPTDSAIWAYTLLTHKGDPNFEIPNEYRGFFSKKLLMATSHLQSLSSMSVAKIMIGLNQEEAQKRRAESKKDDPGWIVDSPIFKDYSAWNGYWIDKVYPRMRAVHGSGLLVLDSEQEMSINLEGTADFIVQSAEITLPLGKQFSPEEAIV